MKALMAISTASILLSLTACSSVEIVRQTPDQLTLAYDPWGTDLVAVNQEADRLCNVRGKSSYLESDGQISPLHRIRHASYLCR